MPADRSRPNILLITSDQHNHEVLGSSGNPVVKTPVLDRLAASGTRFTRAYTPCPLCTPARSSLFTGVAMKAGPECTNVNMWFGDKRPSGVRPEHAAFPELLRAQGYATGLVGKLHTRDAGERGFGLDHTWLAEGKGHFIGQADKRDDYREYLRRKGYPDSVWRTWETEAYRTQGWLASPLPQEDYIDYRVTEQSMRFLEQARAPFFLWTSFCSPHPVWDPPEPYASMYDPADIPPPHRREGALEKKNPAVIPRIAQFTWRMGENNPQRPGGIFQERDESVEPTLANAYARVPEEVLRPMLAAYYGQVSFLDKEIGRLLDFLQARGLLENTLIVYTSDHGEHLGNNWLFYKGPPLYEAILRVPMLVRHPEADLSGRAEDLVSLIDLAPTFLDAAGIGKPEVMEGTSLLRPAPERQSLRMHSWGIDAVVRKDWKLIQYPRFAELYNLREDPHEQDNVADEHPDLVRELAQEIDSGT